MKKELDRNPNLAELQEEVLSFWEQNDTYQKSVAENAKNEKVFYDGPPFPTGMPHHGTVLVSFIKDMVARYQTMQGYSVARQWGWDCHGLPIEVQAEEKLGLKDKTEIETKVGVAKFNETCYNIVSSNNDAWKKYVREMARWCDYDNAYKTMNVNYMESVIWAFKELYNKGLIYKDYRVTPYCARCQTTLSISETRTDDATRPRQDRWVIAKFKTLEVLNGKPVYFLAWTTTPWTLPSNMCLAVNEKLDYVYTEVNGQVYVTGASSLNKYKNIFGEKPVVLKTVKGSDLVGKTYIPLFDYFKNKASEGAFKVVVADYVDDSEGVSIVHTAPAFGEDDYWTCKKNGVPLVCPVDDKGKFTSEVSDYAGRLVFDTNSDVIRDLKERGLYVADGTLVHNYAHCWRCNEPLIQKATEAWYFNIDKIKDELIKQNEKVNWVPDYIKTGRFANWLNNARDWNISRNRYWSTPIPVWECDHCKKQKVLGSIAEIEKFGNCKIDNLHKQYLDKVTAKCECGGTYHRISEVLDCWFESGSTPFARLHYPFENKEWFDKHSPSDFEVEYTGQIRCWFYYLHVLSVALFNKPAYKNCIVHGTVLAKDGKKLSKHSKNYTDPMTLMQTYGTDAFRLYMYNSNAMLVNDMQFDDNGPKDYLQQVILPLWNCAYFYQSYAKIDNFVGDPNLEPKPTNKLDKWVLSKLYATEKQIKASMDAYQVDEYVKPVVSLVDELSNWYIRRSRRRFWGSGMTADKKSAYETLYYVLVNTAKIMAPITPIIAEKLYKSLTSGESVHLTSWPNINKKYNDPELLKEVELVQNVIHLARNIRNKNNIKNRQPLSTLKLAFANPDDYKIIDDYKTIIAEELNVKNVEVVENVSDIAIVGYKINFATVGKTLGSKIPMVTKALRENKVKLANNKYQIMCDEPLTLNREDILVNYTPKDNLPVFSDGESVVALDLTITDDLREEGVAREVVRNIQDARKQLDLEIMDRIDISLTGNVPTRYVEYICRETLANLVDKLDKPSLTLETEGVTIKLKKA